MPTTEIENWDTPFSCAKYPSVWVIAESHGDSTLSVVVCPGGLDAHPKFVVRFTSVYAFSVEEEARSGIGSFIGPDGLIQKVGCAYIWLTSPYIKDFVPEMPFRGGRGPLKHYVILGGDNNVGVVSAEPPTIDRVDAPSKVTVTYRS